MSGSDHITKTAGNRAKSFPTSSSSSSFQHISSTRSCVAAVEAAVGHAFEFGRDLVVGHRVLVVPAGEFVLGGELGSVLERHRDAVGDAARVAGRQIVVAVDLDPRDQVQQRFVTEAFVRKRFERDIAVDKGHRRAVGQAVVGRLSRLGPPFLGVFADDVDGRVERFDVDRGNLRAVGIRCRSSRAAWIALCE